MLKRLGCLHAHYSNIESIEKTFVPFDVAIDHYVDPGLMHRVTSDPPFSRQAAQAKVQEQLTWIAESQVDGILVTCTQYIALIDEVEQITSLPIIKIDEPFFEDVSHTESRHELLFTNPATVDGTMHRLRDYTARTNRTIDAQVHVIENTFDLIMQGKKEQYLQAISRYIQSLLSNGHPQISVCQLSMVEAAVQIEKETGITIRNPLTPLAAHVTKRLNLQKK